MDKFDEILGSKAFISEQHKVMVSLPYVALEVRNWIDNLLDPHGINTSQFNILRALWGAYPEPLSMKTLHQRMVEKTIDLSRAADKLCSMGLIKCNYTLEDKRTREILISEKGQELLQMVMRNFEELTKPAYALTDEEAKNLNECMRKMMLILAKRKLNAQN